MSDRSAPRRQALTRRAFLGGLAAATTALGATAVSCATGGDGDARVAVIGAGLAGLTCAYRLAQQGVDVTVYEARDRVGGRMWSSDDIYPGQVVEHGGEMVFGYYARLRGLISELGLTLDSVNADSRPDMRLVCYLNGQSTTHEEAYAGFDQILDKIYAEAHRIGSWRYDDATDAARALDEMSVHDWIEQHVPGGSGSLLGAAIESDMVHFWSGQTRDLSAIYVLRGYLPPTGSEAPDAWIFYHVRGGNQLIPIRLAERLPAGRIEFGTPLEALRQRGDGFELRFAGKPQTVLADFVVSAVPFSTLRRVDLSGVELDRVRREAIDSIDMGNKGKLTMQFTQPLATYGWNGGIESTAPQIHGWDSSRGQGGPGLLSIFPTGETESQLPTRRPHGPAPQTVVDQTLAQLEQWVPGASSGFSGRAWLDRWSQDPWALGAFPNFRPGQITKYWGLLGEPVGRLFFAGDQTSTRHSACMGGAMESGEDAAAQVLAAMGKPTRLSDHQVQ
ncbi:NAD(P)/FAD-dependent oxidoreductase [Pseudonocardia zijingensis]|uniref:FAD-dependent oxidoreductase n=1 Tax=Pseudonocardia zijingensis TaxID=153376 RepID=A0ABP3YMU9_9PSEU